MKVLIAGDFRPCERIADLVNQKRYDAIFGNVKSIIAKADYSLVNFESPVVINTATSIIKNGPNLKCSFKAVEAIKYAGFKMTTLANNHFLDYGEVGVKDTLEMCRKYDIETVGGGTNLDEAEKVFYKTIGVENLAIINCCEHEFSIATKKAAGSNPLNPIKQYYQIQQARRNADYVLVVVHGGHEHYQLPSCRMQDCYRFFVDAGADAVVNHHQHCFSGFEVYNGRPIVYGLGNFCYDKRDRRILDSWNEGYMVLVNFKEKCVNLELYPYIQCYKDINIELLKNKTSFENNLLKINTIISNRELLERENDEYYTTQDKQMKLLFEPYESRYLRACYLKGILPSFLTKKKYVRLKNFLNCESHFDKVLHFVNKIKI